ncbi:phosphotransferase family protein [Salininema proteolyticum]|uniref:Phosphotransferase family protein n=1 Tax=Salininema proteolyticum TaxID=1607685 RepID=A0ABV8U0K1_9ACTN
MTDLEAPVPYDATAERRSWNELPRAAKDVVRREIGGEPVAVSRAGGGFTAGFAGLVTGPRRTLFVKVGQADMPYVFDCCRREAVLNPALPEGVPAPRLLFAEEADDWIVLGFEPVEGKALKLPLSETDWEQLLKSWAVAAERLEPRPPGMELLEPMEPDFLRHWSRSPTVRFEPAMRRADELAELESTVHEALAVDAVTHGDLRPDNMILGDDGAWICDWTTMVAAAPWFDTACLLILAEGDGLDADAMFWAHPTSRGVSGGQLDAVLAGIIGYYLVKSETPPFASGSSYIRPHQRWNGVAGFHWLARRRGWS